MLYNLIQAARAGDVDARNKILSYHAYIIDMVVAKLSYSRIDEGTKRYGAILGMHAAINKYNFEPTTNFRKYIYICALQRAKREMSGDRLVRVPINRLAKINKAGNKPYEIVPLEGEYERDGFFHKRDSDASFNKNKILPELIIKDVYEDTQAQKLVLKSLKELTGLEQDAIYHSLGIAEDSLKEIGERHGVSYEWVRRTADKGIKKLKTAFINNRKKETYG